MRPCFREKATAVRRLTVILMATQFCSITTLKLMIINFIRLVIVIFYTFSFEATIKQENPNLVNNTTSRVLTYFQVFFHTISVYVRLSKG